MLYFKTTSPFTGRKRLSDSLNEYASRGFFFTEAATGTCSCLSSACKSSFTLFSFTLFDETSDVLPVPELLTDAISLPIGSSSPVATSSLESDESVFSGSTPPSSVLIATLFCVLSLRSTTLFLLSLARLLSFTTE